MSQQSIKSFVIVGGGTAGWISASALSHVLQNTCCKITLIESPDIPTIGVGEATIPSFVDFVKFLGIPLDDFIRNTNASFKLGIKFVDWFKKGHHYWHPFGVIGSKIDGKAFYQHWLKSKLDGDISELTDFSPAIALAKQNRFFIPDPKRPTNLSQSDFALHFDASLVADYLSKYAKSKGVTKLTATVNHVKVDGSGKIEHLQLSNGESVTGDFYIDCSGQRGLLIQQALRVGYVDWKKYLPVDAAVAIQTKVASTFPPFTESIAMDSGWRWRIPLQNRTGNGYVFCRDFCNDQTAIDTLVQNVSEKPVTDPRIIRFTTGKRDKIWHKNCLSVGLSSGFLEPLESTSIHLIMKGILTFIQMMPDQALEQVNIDEYNRLMDMEYECIRDFIVAHYCLTERQDTEFWKMWQHLEIPESLQHKIALFKSHGRLLKNPFDLFAADSWYAVLEGMNVRPRTYDPTVNASKFNMIKTILAKGSKDLIQSAAQQPLHRDFVASIASMKKA